MITISRSAAGLRVFGDAVDPTEITSLLGSAPTLSHRKGDINPRGTGKQVVRKVGMWALDVDDRKPADLNSQAEELLSRLTGDIAVWQSIAQRHLIDLFCGLFLDRQGLDFSFAPATLAELGARGIQLTICVYAPAGDVVVDAPCPCGSGRPCGECCAPSAGP